MTAPKKSHCRRPRRRVLPIACLMAAGLAPIGLGAQATATAPSDPFDRGSTYVQVTANADFEAWDYNLNEEWLGGAAIAVGFVPIARWAVQIEATVRRANLDVVPDPRLAGLTFVVRRQVHAAGPWSSFVELGVGVSSSTNVVPLRGTRFNYLLRSGGGATRRIHRRLHLIGALQWLHLSNNGREGHDRNPDLQALGGYLGILLPL